MTADKKGQTSSNSCMYSKWKISPVLGLECKKCSAVSFSLACSAIFYLDFAKVSWKCRLWQASFYKLLKMLLFPRFLLFSVLQLQIVSTLTLLTTVTYLVVDLETFEFKTFEMFYSSCLKCSSKSHKHKNNHRNESWLLNDCWLS